MTTELNKCKHPGCETTIEWWAEECEKHSPKLDTTRLKVGGDPVVEAVKDLVGERNWLSGLHAANPVTRIDWELFHEQKQTLVDLIAGDATTGQGYVQGHLNGILNLLDAIQDYASDVVGLDVRSPCETDEGMGE